MLYILSKLASSLASLSADCITLMLSDDVKSSEITLCKSLQYA